MRAWPSGITWWRACRVRASPRSTTNSFGAPTTPSAPTVLGPTTLIPIVGLPGASASHEIWVWEQRKAVVELESHGSEVLFVCGSSRNRDQFLQYFTKVLNRRIDEDTMRRRLEARTGDDWPLGQAGVELMLEQNRNNEKPAGAINIEATQPLDKVVDELVRFATP